MKSKECEIIDFQLHLRKRNRVSKKRAKKEKKSDAPVISLHIIEQTQDRKISIKRVKACLKYGRKVFRSGAIHYILKNLHVVVSRDETTAMTAYNRTDMAA